MNSKPNFTFHFVDEPQFKGPASRVWVANALRSYRKQPRFTLIRIAPHTYNVHVVLSSAVARIEVQS